MKRIIVTGANKGIGYAIVEAILASQEDMFVMLGCRDEQRGQAAVAKLAEANSGWGSRTELLLIDVSDEASVRQAARVTEKHGRESLYGIVNNAGIGLSDTDLMATLQVNTYGVRRVCDAFVPLLQESGGRVVNITSASGPKFVEQCSPERQAMLINPKVTWDDIDGVLRECLSLEQPGQFAARGFGEGSAYGLSKACANAYTVLLANECPQHTVNACTPGYIETDMTRPMAQAQGVTPRQMGMKPPAAGTASAIFLLFGQPEGSGHYYGSDALRSPLDRYRAPGSPAFTG